MQKYSMLHLVIACDPMQEYILKALNNCRMCRKAEFHCLLTIGRCITKQVLVYVLKMKLTVELADTSQQCLSVLSAESQKSSFMCASLLCISL